MGFIWLPLSMGFEYVLVTICIFSGWVEVFSCQKAVALYSC